MNLHVLIPDNPLARDAFVGAASAAITFLYGTNLAAEAAPTEEDRSNKMFGINK